MTLFANYNNTNFYRNLCKEIDNAQHGHLTAVYTTFSQKNGSFFIERVDEARWNVFDYQLFTNQLESELSFAEKRVAQLPSTVESVRECEDMSKAFFRVLVVAEYLLKETGEIIIRNNNTGRASFEQVLEILSNKTTIQHIQALIGKIENKAFAILKRQAPKVDWQKFLRIDHSYLNTALRNNKKKLAISLIESGVDLEMVDSDGDTPLVSACMKDDLKLAELLLQKGADVNGVGFFKRSALHIAAARGNLALVSLLLKYKANVNLVNSERATPLVAALKNKRVGAARSLLQAGAEPNAMTIDGDTALSLAITKGCNIVDALLKHRADPNLEVRDGKTPLLLACEERNARFMKALLAKGADVNKQDKLGRSALHIACENRDVDLLLELFRYNPQINIEDKNGNTPLLFSLQNGFVGLAVLLMSKGADVSKQNKKGDTVLALCLKNAAHFLPEFLEKNIKESHFLKFKDGSTPLHQLFLNPFLVKPEVVLAELFLRLMKKFDVTCKDKSGKTPFQYLINSSRGELATKLGKLIFSEFGAIDDAMKIDGINSLQNYFRAHTQTLISHPKNKPTANPFKVALLLDSQLLAYDIARKLNAKDFVGKCQELERDYPQVPVLQFFFKTFIHSPLLDQTPLPEGHIQALFSYLATKIDVTVKNNDLQTPLVQLLLKNDVYAYDIIWEIFTNFGGVSQKFKSREEMSDYVLEELSGPISRLKFFVEDCAKRHANPMEASFLFGSKQRARKIASQMKKLDFQKAKGELEKSYPKSQVGEYFYNLEYRINREHFKKGVTVIPEKPAGVQVRDLLNFFDTVNFTNPDAPLYFDPKLYGLNSNPSELRKILVDFIEKIEGKNEFIGTPKKDTDAITQFYKVIENAVAHVVKKLQTENNENLSAHTIIDYLKDVYQCGGKIFTISIEIFNKVIHNIDANFENRVFALLGELRALLARDVIPESINNVHDYNKFVHEKGPKLGIPGHAEASQFVDNYSGGAAFNVPDCEKRFLKLYSPYRACVSWLFMQLKSDQSFREKYTSWWKQNVPKEWRRDKYGRLFDELSILQGNMASKERILKFFENRDMELGNNQTPEEAIEDMRTHEFIEKEVYESLEANTFSLTRFTECLLKIGVLKKAEIIHEDERGKKELRRPLPVFFPNPEKVRLEAPLDNGSSSRSQEEDFTSFSSSSNDNILDQPVNSDPALESFLQQISNVF